ncbi:MAG: hypothetical protein Q9174_004640, partial [Haloplaca sp. 1 TL-2023]
MKLRSSLSKFKQKCKAVLKRKEPAEDDGQHKAVTQRRRLVKKSRKDIGLVTNPAPEVGDDPNQACLPTTQEPSLPEIAVDTSEARAASEPSSNVNGQAPTRVIAYEEALNSCPTLSRGTHVTFEDTPPKQSSSASTRGDTPTRASHSTQTTPSTQSSRSIPISFLCELPGSSTFNDPGLQHDQSSANTALVEQKNESREQEAKYWGVRDIVQTLDENQAADRSQAIAADIYQQQQEDPFHDFGMVPSRGRSEVATTQPSTHVMAIAYVMNRDPFNVFEPQLPSGGHADAATAELIPARNNNDSRMAVATVGILPSCETSSGIGLRKAPGPITVGWNDIQPSTNASGAIIPDILEQFAAEPAECYSSPDGQTASEAYSIFSKDSREEYPFPRISTILSNSASSNGKIDGIRADQHRVNDSLNGLDDDVANEDLEIGNDHASVSSETPSAWERAYESQEQTHKIELQDLNEDHAAEVQELNETVTALQEQLKDSVNRKQHVEKIHQKKCSEKEIELQKQITRTHEAMQICEGLKEQLNDKDQKLEDQKRQMDLLGSESKAKSKLLESQRVKESNHDKCTVQPMRQEIARLTQLNREFYWQTRNQEDSLAALTQQLKGQPNLPIVQAALDNASRDRDIARSDLERVTQAFQQALGDRNNAYFEIDRLTRRIQDTQELQDDSGIPGKDLLQKTQERYQELEKKANTTFNLWRDDKKRHENEKIVLKAEIEEQRNMALRLEGTGIQTGRELNRMCAIVEQYVESNRAGSQNVNAALQAMVDASKTTCDELKDKNAALESQIKVQEKENLDQKTTLRLRERFIMDKDLAVKKAEDAEANAEIAVDHLYHVHKMQTLGHEETIEEQSQQLKSALNKCGDLEAHIESLMHSGFGVDDPDTLDRFQSEIVNLQQYITDLKEVIAQHEEKIKALEPPPRTLSDAIDDAATDHGYHILKMNWADAQEEIQRLKKTLEVVRNGCDPEKFEVAQNYSKLKQVYDKLDRRNSELEMEHQELEYHNGKLQGRYDRLERDHKTWLAKTSQDKQTSQAADRGSLDDAMKNVAFLGQIAENLIGNLAEAWCGPSLEIREDDQEGQRRKQELVDALVAIREITGNPDETEGAADEDAGDIARGLQAVAEQALIQVGIIDSATVTAGTVDEGNIDSEYNEYIANFQDGKPSNNGQRIDYPLNPTPSPSHPPQPLASHPPTQLTFVETGSAPSMIPRTTPRPGPTFGVDYIGFGSESEGSEDDEGFDDEELYE